ncbi:morphogenic membrane protein MmpB [Streptomyces sp. NPDC102406]
MLWSDPENEPPEELRETQEMLRRAGLVLALAVFLAMVTVGLGVL